jgi:hypothetical protein
MTTWLVSPKSPLGTCCTIFFGTYGNITAVDPEINFEHMRRAWDPQQPVESLLKQIQDCADYSEAGGVLIGNPQQINVGYAKKLQLGTSWAPVAKSLADKTWAQFKAHFSAAHRQHKQMQGESSATSGYHSANTAVGQTEDQMAEATIGALANLATATAADRGVVATLTEANARLVKQLEDNSNELWEFKALIKKERFEKCGQRSFNPSPHKYCWTHGYKVANTHASLSCNFPKQGHKREATITDNMGGSQANKEWCSGAKTLNNRSMFEECRPPPLLKPHETAIVDSGCTGHFLLVNAPCLNNIKSRNPLTVRLPNDATMESSHTAALDIPELNAAPSIVNVLPGMANHYLLSVGKLCNEGYTVTFKNASVTICDPQEFQILSGARDLDTGLWRINLRKENQQSQHAVANNVYELRKTGALVN